MYLRGTLFVPYSGTLFVPHNCAPRYFIKGSQHKLQETVIRYRAVYYRHSFPMYLNFLKANECTL